MRVFSIGFLVFLVFAIFARWYFICELRHLCANEPAPAGRSMTLSLTDDGKIILQGYEQFGFKPNAFEPDMTANNRQFLADVAAYLQKMPDKNITLAGHYLPTEAGAKSGIFENLGIARAAAVEQLLVQLGIAEQRISLDHLAAVGETLEEPVSFALYTPKKGDYDRPAYKFTDNTFSDANFEFGSDIFRPGEQCILYADSVYAFLTKNPQMYLSIIGHTDSIGTEKANYELGLRRARSAAQYFRELGLKAKVNTSSKGETQPVAPNSKPDGSDNPDGRQKNRRVNFKIEESAVK